MTESFTQFRTNHRQHSIPNYQCVDEIRAFLRECLGATGSTFDWIKPGNAVNFYENANPEHFRKIPNGPTNHPAVGDIVVAHHVSRGSDGVYRDYGHVFNAMVCTAYELRGYGQNWTIAHACDYEYHPHYVQTNWRVIGWLHPLAHLVL